MARSMKLNREDPKSGEGPFVKLVKEGKGPWAGSEHAQAFHQETPNGWCFPDEYTVGTLGQMFGGSLVSSLNRKKDPTPT